MRSAGADKTNMLAAGVDKAHRDMILGHSLQGMDVHYLSPREESLKEAMERFTLWLRRNSKRPMQMLTKPLTKKSKSQKAVAL
ncbi:MAG: hypothetical protein AB1512_29875 [Thermodesulfobacteriota bacterium]